MKRIQIVFNLDYDIKFFAIIPAVNLNFHNRFTFEIEWLFFALYAYKTPSDNNIN